jgi:hypothetical protein
MSSRWRVDHAKSVNVATSLLLVRNGYLIWSPCELYFRVWHLSAAVLSFLFFYWHLLNFEATFSKILDFMLWYLIPSLIARVILFVIY